MIPRWSQTSKMNTQDNEEVQRPPWVSKIPAALKRKAWGNLKASDDKAKAPEGGREMQ